jgi:hypothetical protein
MREFQKQKLYFLLEPKAMVFGFALFYYISDYVFWKQMLASSTCNSPLPCSPPGYVPAVGVPFILLLASIALWVSKFWSYLIAMWFSGQLIYEYSYQMLVSCTFINNQPLLSRATFRCWWVIIGIEEPRFSLYLIFSSTIFIYATIALIQYIYQRYRH